MVGKSALLRQEYGDPVLDAKLRIVNNASTSIIIAGDGPDMEESLRSRHCPVRSFKWRLRSEHMRHPPSTSDLQDSIEREAYCGTLPPPSYLTENDHVVEELVGS